MPPILQCKEVCKKWKKFYLHPINFSLEPGYILGIMGEHGSGKSTLIQLILGGYRMDSVDTRKEKQKNSQEMVRHPVCIQEVKGDIEVDGYSLRFHSNQAKEKMAYVLNKCPFSMVMTGRENAAIYGVCYQNWNQKTFENYCREYKVPLTIPLRKLSKGQQVLFQLAFALSYDAKLFLMDEPAGNLDVAYKQILLDKMQELVENGERSVIYVTHQLEDLEQIGDYILWLDKGKQVLFEDKESMLSKYCIVKGTKKQFEYIKQRNPKQFLLEHIGVNVSEALILGNGRNLPLKLESKKPSMEELLYYYNFYQKQKGKNFFQISQDDCQEGFAEDGEMLRKKGFIQNGSAIEKEMDEKQFYESPYEGL